MALLSLGSFLRNSRDPVQLLIHDDGSMDDESITALLRLHPAVKMVRRRAADDQINDRLARHPVCLNYRRKFAFGLKLFDVPLLSEAPFGYTDTDILYRWAFRGLFRLPSTAGMVFMRDLDNQYACTTRDVALGRIPALPWRANFGLFCARPSVLDLDFVEALLDRLLREQPQAVTVIEQTVWGCLAMRAGCCCWDPTQVAIASETKPMDALTVIHFAGNTRPMLAKFAGGDLLNGRASTASRTEAPCEQIRTVRAKRLRLPALVTERLVMKWRNRTQRSIDSGLKGQPA
jgi:hypothetical protein